MLKIKILFLFDKLVHFIVVFCINNKIVGLIANYFVDHTKRKEMKLNTKNNCVLSLLKNGQYKLALEQLYRFFPQVRNFIQKNGGDAQDAKLIFHEALVLFFRKAQEIEFKINEHLYDHIIEIVSQLWKNRLTKLRSSLRLIFALEIKKITP